MKTYDLEQVRNTPPSFESEAQDSRDAKFWTLTPFEGGHTWLGEWQGESPWERHQAGDECLEFRLTSGASETGRL